MHKFKDMKPDDETRRLQYEVAQAFTRRHPIEGRDLRKTAFLKGHPMSDVFRSVAKRGEEHYIVAAEHFVDVAASGAIPRTDISLLIADLLLAMREVSGNGTLREKVVTHATPFMNVLVRERPDLVLAWAEDMGPRGLPQEVLSTIFALDRLSPAERLRLVSGALLASTFDQQAASVQGAVASYRVGGAPYRTFSPLPFWEQAVRSPAFPIEIFSSPAHSSEDGIVFSGNRRSVIGRILSSVSDLAARRIAEHIVKYAVRKSISVFDKEEQKSSEVEVDCEAGELRVVLKDLHSAIDATEERRAMVAEIFGIKRVYPTGGTP